MFFMIPSFETTINTYIRRTLDDVRKNDKEFRQPGRLVIPKEVFITSDTYSNDSVGIFVDEETSTIPLKKCIANHVNLVNRSKS
ncbi:hypothetical protein EG487_20135 [Paenibacillus polymyxa]|nr:hypothetical protein EG487_20135 [Paenibacillus polymyxa]